MHNLLAQLEDAAMHPLSVAPADWEPCSLFECIGSEWLAWLTLIGCAFVVGGYAIIIWRTWLPPALRASKGARSALLAMAALFLLCALSGYATLIIAAWSPRLAYPVRAVALLLQCASIVWFLSSKRSQEFTLIGRHESIGKKIEDAVAGPMMEDRELASLARTLIKENLADMAERFKTKPTVIHQQNNHGKGE